MNRNERRSQQKQSTELATWYRTLPQSKKNFIQYAIEKQIIENDRIINIILDKCYMAATANNIDIDIIELEKIIAETSTYMQDYKDKIEKGDMIEMIKTAEKPIQSKIRSFIKEKKDKVASIKELENEYNIPLAELDVMWLAVKQTMGIVNKHAPKINVAEDEVKEILEETQEQADRELKEVIKKHQPKEAKTSYPVTVTKEQIPYVVTPKKIKEGQYKYGITIEEASKLETVKAEFVNPNKPKLKILEQIIKIQGQHGIYTKTTEGVKTDKINVKDIKDLEEYKNAVDKEYNKSREELNKKLSEVQAEIVKLDMRADKNFSIIEEIKQVFLI